MRAALIYQHATSDRDREIAAALGARIQREAGEKWPVDGPALPVSGSPAVEDDAETGAG